MTAEYKAPILRSRLRGKAATVGFAMQAAAMLGLCNSEDARAASRRAIRRRYPAQARWEHNWAGSERDEMDRSDCRSLAMAGQEPCTFLMAT